MPDIRGLVQDPDFKKLPAERKRAILTRAGADSNFINEIAPAVADTPAPEEAPTEEPGGVGNWILENIPGAEPAARKAKELLGEKSPGQFALDLPLPKAGVLQPFGSLGEATEALPAAGGAVGTLVGGLPGAVAGGMGGEALRMGVRGAVGAPPATGMIQQLNDMDPESAEAIFANLGIEGLMSVLGLGVGKAGQALAPHVRQSARRSLNRLLNPRAPRELLKREPLSERMIAENIAPMGRTRATQIKLADKALESANVEAEAMKKGLAESGSPVNESVLAEMLEDVSGVRPASLPGGGPSRLAKPATNRADEAIQDMAEAVEGMRKPSGRVELEDLVGERRRVDDLLNDWYISGSEDAKGAIKATKGSADSLRAAIRKTSPELADLELKRSELITISKLLKQSLEDARWAGADPGGMAAAAAGGGAGRQSIPAMFGGRLIAMMTAGPVASFSSGAKRMMETALKRPELAQALIRLNAGEEE